MKANGEAKVQVSGTTTTSEPLSSDANPARYTCSGDRLVQETDLAKIEMRKA